jgi:hypothetical protein
VQVAEIILTESTFSLGPLALADVAAPAVALSLIGSTVPTISTLCPT